MPAIVHYLNKSPTLSMINSLNIRLKKCSVYNRSKLSRLQPHHHLDGLPVQLYKRHRQMQETHMHKPPQPDRRPAPLGYLYQNLPHVPVGK